MEEKTGVIILAAGSSSRLGQPKQLLEFKGKSLLFHTVEQAVKVSNAIVVVTGSNSLEVENEINGQKVLISYNPDWQKGMGLSVSSGLKRLLLDFSEIEYCIISVCDQPYIDANVFSRLIEEQHHTQKGIVASAYAETLGTPVLFAKKYFNDLLIVSGNEGAKKLLQKFKDDVAEISFEEGAVDIDTIGDYEQLIKLK
jgi:molybdenum cofactor cytidylyltransferase